METIRLCRQCSAPLTTGAPGSLCPNCQQTPTGIASVSPTPVTAPAPPTAAQIAEFFPQLEVYELLGFGGMGMVYKARQLNLDRLVALKILSPELSSQAAFAERFSREAKALARLHHSNIVSVYDFGRAGPYYYFLMEFVDGVDLHTLIQRRELMPPEAIRITLEICHALQFAHDEGIIHRDIKPANILLDKKGRVKMADFGLAKLAASSGQRLTALTQATGMMGTPQYMAPEQIEKPSEVDHRADLYSLGVIFYEMLTGELPLGRFAPPSHKARLDVRLDQVVLRALEKDPALRFQQAGDIGSQIESFSAPATAAVRNRKIAVVYQVGMACALLLIAVLAYALFHRAPTVAITSEQSPRGPGQGFFTNTAEGMDLSPRAIAQLQASKDQVQVVNTIVHVARQDFAQIQHKYSNHSRDAGGHIHVLLRPMAEEDLAQVQKLKEKMWKELAPIFTPEQLAKAKQPFETSLFRANANRTENVEIWKDKAGEYHYVDDLESPRAGESFQTNVSTNISVIPLKYRNLLDEKSMEPTGN